ncbi:general transcription factor 3C polypeptide [Trifolium repens]|nr:general transcription factor 3C polypeptide [Trifolium repens]
MEENATPHEDQDEYVLLDLDGVYGLIDIPPNANYVLTGLDTLNPVLIIDDKFKLVGEYEETIGTVAEPEFLSSLGKILVLQTP